MEAWELLRTDLRQLDVAPSDEQSKSIAFLAERRYNRFDLYAPGESFHYRLIQWLSNFEKADRAIAMEIVGSLVYLTHNEMRALAATTFENVRRICADDLDGLPRDTGVPFLDARSDRRKAAIGRCLFVAASDDVLFDFFRRSAQHRSPLNKDHFVEYYKLDRSERAGLEKHDRIFLLDQLAASGTTAIRKEDGKWKGKIPRFYELWEDDVHQCTVYYCPYIISTMAEETISSRVKEWASERKVKRPPKVLSAMRIPVSKALRGADGRIDESRPAARLCKKYHKYFREHEHIAKGGPSHYGYGGAGLTLVLSTNCPNNTLPIIWHDHEGWKPLFPRIEHHKPAGGSK